MIDNYDEDDLAHASIQLHANLIRKNSDGTIGDLDAVRFWAQEIYCILGLDILTDEDRQEIVNNHFNKIMRKIK